MTKLGTLVTAAALSMFAVTAQGAIKINATTTFNFISSATFALVPLNNSGARSLSFNLPANQKMLLTYSASCAVGSTTASLNVWLDLDIIVNGVAVAPTVGTLDPFCSSNHTTILDERTRASITVQIQGIAGSNTVQIVAKRHSGTTSMLLGYSALLVYD